MTVHRSIQTHGPTPSSGKIAVTGFEPKVVTGEDDRWTLPPSDKIEKMSRKALRDRIRAIIEHAERGDAQNRRGNHAEQRPASATAMIDRA